MNSAQTIILSYTGTLGNTNTGSNSQSISNTIRGAPFVASQTGTAQSISAYLNVGSSSSRNMKAAIYTTSGTLVGSTNAVTGLTGSQWVTFSFGTKPTLTAGTTYVLVVWADSGSSTVSLYYSGTSTNSGYHTGTITYGTWPSSTSLTADTYQYCIYCMYSMP
jgi:hypothetical protein